MTNLTDILTGSINVKRSTNFVVDGITPTATVVVNRQPAKASRMQVKIEGAVVSSGLVNIAGDNNETFSFSDNDTLVGVQDIATISGITTSGIVGGSIFIEALNRLGQPNNQKITAHSALAIRFYAKDGKIRMQKTGQEKIAEYKIMAAPGIDLRENDVIEAISGVVGLTRGIIDFVESISDFSGVGHHVECEIKDL